MVTSDPQVPKVGNVSTRIKEWEKIYKDPWILEMARGVTIPLREEGQGQKRAPFPFRLSQLEEQALGVEMTKLIETGLVEETTLEQDQFILNVFLRPKKNGGFRLVLDLTECNKGVDYRHFKMTSLQTVIDSMRPRAWMRSVDLKDAYNSVKLAQSDRRFLKFVWEGKVSQFVRLPNGLACAPRLFTKLMKSVFSSLAEQGCECLPLHR